MKPRLLLFCGIATLSTVTAVGVRNWFTAHAAQNATKRIEDVVASQPPIVPVVVTFKEVLSVPGKPDILSTERKYAIRADGSEARIDRQHRNDGALYLAHWELKLADGTTAEGDDATQTMTAVKVPRGRIGAALNRWDPATSCSVQVSGVNRTSPPITHENLLGIDTVKLQLSNSPTTRITVWRAPNLNCLEMRRLAEFKNPDGSIKDTSDLFATEVLKGEPDPSLFTLPSYANVSYSERHGRLAAALGAPAPPATEMRVVERPDAMYAKYKLAP